MMLAHKCLQRVLRQSRYTMYTVPHDLLSKLNGYGVSLQAIHWIRSFLTGRKQYAIVNVATSDVTDVISGVPQGTVLGPLLFSVHIHDTIQDISPDIRLFADQSVCYRTIHSVDDSSTLQQDIDTLGNWARTWEVRFKPVKCNIMQLYRKINKIYFQYILIRGC